MYFAITYDGKILRNHREIFWPVCMIALPCQQCTIGFMAIVDRISKVFYIILGLLELLLAMRVVLILIGTVSEAAFTAFVYRFSQYLVGPFQGTVPPSAFGSFVVEWDSIIAMLVYAIGVFIFMKILKMILPKSPDAIA